MPLNPSELAELSFIVPPFNHGQAVEVAYAVDRFAADRGRQDYIIQRTIYPATAREPVKFCRYEDPQWEEEASDNLDFWDRVPELGACTEEWEVEPGGARPRYIAIIAEDKAGPAYGIGTSEAEARASAVESGFYESAGIPIEITEDSYRRILGGDPDAVEEVE